MKEDLGQFAYNAGLKIKVVPRTSIYYENYDKIFRKIFCNICGLQCYDKDGTKDTGKEYICINCMDRYNKQIGGKNE